MFNLRKNLDDSIGLLITPSWLSMVVCVAIGLLIVLGSVLSLHYHGSYTEQFVYQTKTQEHNKHSNNEHGEAGKSMTQVLISNAPLMILWGGIGAIAYSFTMGLIRSFKSGYELHEEMDYVNINKDDLIKTAVEKLIIKVVALLTWFIFLTYSVQVILPYIIDVVNAGDAAGNFVYTIAYALFAFVIAVLCLHIHAILLRLVVLRPRIFGNA